MGMLRSLCFACLMLMAAASCQTQGIEIPTDELASEPLRTSTTTPSPTSTAPPTSTITPVPTKTPIPLQPPSINYSAPQVLNAGSDISIELSIIDFDGDAYELSITQVLGMGDQYRGKSYVSSRPLKILDLENGVISMRSDFPGNYRIKVTASDKDGESILIIEVPVTWSPGRNPFQVRGIAIDTWGPPDWHDLAYVPRLIDSIAATGANFVELSPYWHAESTSGSTISSCSQLPPAQRGCTTPTDEQIRQWIRHAHSLGLGVLLKPHLNVGNFYSDRSAYDAESWQIRPSDPGAWFESYSKLLLQYARLADEENVEIFSVGNELMGTIRYETRWRDLILTVRSVYDGLLTYSNVDLWTNGPTVATFWDALDLMGVPYYYPGSRNNYYPSIEDMVDFIRAAQSRNLSKAMNQFDMALMATELGRPNFDGTNFEPWDWTDRTVDNQELVDWVEAALETQVELAPRFQGTFIWVLKPRRASFSMDWDFRDKPLLDAVTLWYSN